MSVCRFSRPTSCRPCLISSIALSYRILSGCALLSTLVDLSTFFLWKIWASTDVAPSKNSAPRVKSARLFPATHSFEVALRTIRPKLHLSRECRVPRRISRLNPLETGSAHTQHHLNISQPTGTIKYNLNERQ